MGWQVKGWKIALAAAALAPVIGAMLGQNASSGNAHPAAEVVAPPDASRSNYQGNTWAVVKPGEHVGYSQRRALINRGQVVYAMYCIGCHGPKGDGDGVAAKYLITKPRDFTKGIFKFRSTDSSSLPLETDLYRTITRGLARVSMPAFPLVPEGDKVALIEYIKTFYPDWSKEAPQRVVVFVPRAPQDLHDTDRVERGRAVYLSVGCASCHGTDGQGRGATRIQYTDAWGHPQRPFNFTRGKLKGGDDPEDIYRTFHTGLRSIMPQFGPATMGGILRSNVASAIEAQQQPELKKYLDTFPADMDAVGKLSDAERRALVERNSWDLVAYVLSLRSHADAPAPEINIP